MEELVDPPRLLRPSGEIHVEVIAHGPTEDERMIQTVLTGLGTIQVRDKVAFGQELATWMIRNVRELRILLLLVQLERRFSFPDSRSR